MFEKFTEGAIKVIMISQEESRRMGHNFVGTEQLLLGVLGQKKGIGGKALNQMGINLQDTRLEIEKYIGRGKGVVSPEIPFTPRAKRVLEVAIEESDSLNQNFVGTEHLLLALLNEKDGIARRTLEAMGVNIRDLRSIVYSYMEDTEEKILRPLTEVERIILEHDTYGSKTPTLDEYSENLSRKAVRGNMDPIIGRDDELEALITVLGRRLKNNPVLIGEPGVGKTAVAEGLALLTLTENVPQFLQASIIMDLNLGSILAGTKYRGEFEDRLKRILEEAQDQEGIIVVIDEIHTIVGAGAAEGAVDAANILKPALARGKFRLIGATTKDEYRKYIERDPALERRFQPIIVEEPDIRTAVKILVGLRPKFEEFHVLSYTNASLEQAVKLSDKHVADRFLPDKAIDVMDEAGSRVKLENRQLPFGLRSLMEELQIATRDKERAIKVHNFKAAQQLLDYEMEIRAHITIMKQSILKNAELYDVNRVDMDMVTDEDVAAVISKWTKVPVSKLTGDESARLLKMEETIHERIVGQTQAVTAVARAVRRARSGIRNDDRPIGSFIFAGPTGVGKTELTKALADYVFGSEDEMIRLDMSEYMEKHTVAKLIGSPPGYIGYNEGGQLTDAVRSKPYSVVLFDEVEKAHPDVFNILLQILDDGRLTDSQGRLIDFTSTLIIMTTNTGAKAIQKESGVKERLEEDLPEIATPDPIYGWRPAPEPEPDPEFDMKVFKLVNDELKNFFRPEFLNRIDDIIVFKHLTQNDIWAISDILLKKLVTRVEEQRQIKLVIKPSVQALLADRGFNPIYGARPLRRAIMKYLEDRIAEECLSKPLYPKTQLIIDRERVEEQSNIHRLVYNNNIIVKVDYSNVSSKYIQREKTEEQKRMDRIKDKIRKGRPERLNKKPNSLEVMDNPEKYPDLYKEYKKKFNWK